MSLWFKFIVKETVQLMRYLSHCTNCKYNSIGKEKIVIDRINRINKSVTMASPSFDIGCFSLCQRIGYWRDNCDRSEIPKVSLR